MIKAIDVSSNQGMINWEKLPSQIDYVILRSVLKSGKPDSQFDYNVRKLNELSIPYDVYKYVYATTVEGINQEIYDVIKLIQDTGAKAKRIWLDIEDDSLQKLGCDTLTGIVKVGVEATLKNGFYAGVYTGYYCLAENWFTMPDCPLWIARYPSNVMYELNDKHPSTTYVDAYEWSGWQYTSKARINGIPNLCDLSIFDEDIMLLHWENTDTYLQNTIYGNSIQKALEEIGVDGSYKNRKKIALRNGMSNYTGTAEENLKILKLLRNGELLKI